jgi:GntR family transcriptional regulator, rspAB operon transcriptional repressor
MSDKLNFTDNSAIWVKVYEHIRDRILSGEIAPNQRLVEATIAKEIGTSRTPVREALHNMQKEGLVESIPRVGYKVRAISDAEVAQICRIREVLETLAATWAMEKDQKTLVRGLKMNIEASRKQISKGDLNAFIELDAQFHETIARMSGSTHIMEITQLMRRHMLRYRISSFHYGEVAQRALDGHNLILQALERSDPEEVGRAIHYHLDLSLRDIITFGLTAGDQRNEAQKQSAEK